MAAAIKTRVAKAKLEAFFDHLAQTANVSESAKVAGIASSTVYRLRACTTFRSRWTEALSHGYARLEADAIAETLQPISSRISERTLKLRAQKQRDRMNLLSVHRAAARGVARPGIDPAATALPTEAEARAIISVRLDRIAARMRPGGARQAA